MPIVKGLIGRKKGEKMEQKINKLGAFVATLALIASVLVMPNVSADGEDLSISLTGDKGLTSYGAKYGQASFIGSVTNTNSAPSDGLSVSASFSDDSKLEGWNDDSVSIGSWDGTTCDFLEPGEDFGTIDAAASVDFCISVGIDGAFDNGAVGELAVSASTDDFTSLTEDSQVIVSDWTFSTQDVDAKTFEESEAIEEDCNVAVNCQTYTITIHNNKLDESGDPVDLTDPVRISYDSATPGWRIDSMDTAWNELERKAIIGFIEAGESYDFVINVSLSGSYALATSYTENPSVLAFTIQDDNNIYDFVEYEAIVLDNFAVSVQGSGNEDVDNGCSDQDYKVDWDVDVKNFGNTRDNFSVTFNLADSAGWVITGANDGTISNILPKAENGMTTYELEMTVPSGLAAGTKHGFTMTVTSEGDPSQTQTQEFSATVVQCYGISMSVDKTTDSANPGASSDFTVTVTNDGNGEDTVSFDTMGASAWTPTLSEMTSTIASGATSQVVFSMTVPADSSSAAKSGMAMVHGYSEVCGDDTSGCKAINSDYEAHVSMELSSNQVYDIAAGYYYNASMASASVQEGMALQLKFNVTNNGNGNDNIAVALSTDAPSWITLSQDTVLVGPGTETTVTLDILAPVSGSLGVNTFQIIASSSDGLTSSTTGDFTVTIVEKSTDSSGPTTEEVDDDDGGLPGFGFLSAIAAIGAVLLLRRRL
ncbi:MAG: hypothetical protein BEU01_02915 [Marine Group III euryarchaeote CG-Epi4]|uniref:Alpha-galactosidase NEW3 domain-containing protein n=1 Tax=Marine Group III euryarchaeote CG-Epi4 TaxID=1888998 RepID=A0A1J5UAM1_9ARCH|nr:MAG: hypothetical protein BEU01_02915 [Marine Group III euryarchaeote CG-Epi4]